MKFHLEVDVTFDGTNMALEILEIADYDTATVYLEHNDLGAKVIEFLRAKALDVYDRRVEPATPELGEVEDRPGEDRTHQFPAPELPYEPPDKPKFTKALEPAPAAAPAPAPSLGPSRSFL